MTRPQARLAAIRALDDARKAVEALRDLCSAVAAHNACNSALLCLDDAISEIEGTIQAEIDAKTD